MDRLSPEDAALTARLSSFDDNIAKERGRLFAARAITENPEQRKRVEDAFGVPACKAMWPEAYLKGQWRDLLKFIPDMMNPFRS